MHNSAASNYGAGEYASNMMTVLALAGRMSFNVTDGAGDNQFSGHAIVDPQTNAPITPTADIAGWRSANVVALLTGAAPFVDASLAGGFWAEGWNYGQLATRNLIMAGLAFEEAGLGAATAERGWAAQVLTALITEQADRGTMYDGGDWYAYPSPFVGADLISITSFAASDPTIRSYGNYISQNYSQTPTNNFLDLFFRDPSAPANSWTTTLPLQYKADGTGLVTARADWSYNSTWVSLQLGNTVAADHQLQSPGHIQIQRGSDDLLLNGNAIRGVPWEKTFSNFIIIDDNGDGLQNYRFKPGDWYGSPGCRINRYEAAASYVYADGDYRAAYSLASNPGGGGSSTELTRQWLYVRPDYVIVHDRAGTVKDTYAKQLRWHFREAPNVSGNSFTLSHGASKLFGSMYGTQKGTNGTIALDTTDATTTGDGTTNWDFGAVTQMITTNHNPALNVRYTTVFQSAPATATGPVSFTPIFSSDYSAEGEQVADWVALFGKDGPITTAITYAVSGSSAIHHVVVDLVPGKTYAIAVDSGSGQQSVTASAQGVLTFVTTPQAAKAQTITIQ
jgi:hypothetical protein